MADLIDLKGQSFGKLIVVEKGSGRKTKGGCFKTTWVCKCECGNTKEIDGEKLRRGHTQSCGCLKQENKGSRFEDLTGRRFERLTVIEFIPESERTTRGYDWLCLCDCGNTVKANAYKLKTGLQKSCGCLKEEMKSFLGDKTRKYQYSNKRLYSVYKAMLDRCYNEKTKRYNNYGAMGVDVCKEWLGENGYDTFAEWALESGYNPNASWGETTLDRIDTTKGYGPDNCRWITNIKQQNNRRYNRIYEYDGRKQTIAEWARELNIPYWKLYQGLTLYNKTLEFYFND